MNFNIFLPEIKKHLIEIFGDLLEIKKEPNPLALGLSSVADKIIEGILDKFDEAGMSTSYGNIFKLMCNKTELISHFLHVDIFLNLSKHVSNAVFDVSSEALSVYQEILFSENKKVEEKVIIRLFSLN